MPRGTKDVDTETTKKVTKKAEPKKKTTAKKTSSTKASTSKKTTTKKSSTTKTATTKKSSTTKATATKKTTTARKTATKKTTTTRKKTSTTKSKKTPVTTNFITEYYDLPYRYNQTIVKILAQTPKKLFVYWDVSDYDRENMQRNYGDNFFEITKPVLIIHNITLNYSFEVEINDFANSWYIDINDAKCEYNIELGRRPIPREYLPYMQTYNNQIPDYIYISSSNNLEVPNNKVLYNPPIYKKIRFRNVKTGEIIEKDISEFPFLANPDNMGQFYNIYDLYKKFYTSEDLDYIHNPSSGQTSSKINSSQFK